MVHASAHGSRLLELSQDHAADAYIAMKGDWNGLLVQNRMGQNEHSQPVVETRAARGDVPAGESNSVESDAVMDAASDGENKGAGLAASQRNVDYSVVFDG